MDEIECSKITRIEVYSITFRMFVFTQLLYYKQDMTQSQFLQNSVFLLLDWLPYQL